MGKLILILFALSTFFWVLAFSATDPQLQAGFGVIALIIGIALGIVIYFIPTIVAARRNHLNLAGIFVVNLLLGWSIFGWAGAMVWAVAKRSPDYAPTSPQVSSAAGRHGRWRDEEMVLPPAPRNFITPTPEIEGLR